MKAEPQSAGHGGAHALRVLLRLETQLRARGLTGARALDAFLDAVRATLGDPVDALPVASQAVAELNLRGERDLLGLAYERFVPKRSKGRGGQFFTPPEIAQLLVGGAGIQPGDDVLDPTCGSGGLLLLAAALGARVRGGELDDDLVRLCELNLRLRSHSGAVGHVDCFSGAHEPADVVLANPPYSVEIDDPGVLERFEQGSGRSRVLSDVLFVEALEGMVRPGGHAAVVLPWSLIANPSWHELRRRIDAAWVREALCELPEGVFRPFGGAAGRACLVWMRRRPAPAQAVRFARLVDPGYDPRSRLFKPTQARPVDILDEPERWLALPSGAWRPSAAVKAPSVPRRAVSEFAVDVTSRRVPSRQPDRVVVSIDLADTCKSTGEVVEAPSRSGSELTGARVALPEGSLMVSRMRPDLRNAAVVPHELGDDAVGSPEWIVLDAGQYSYYLHTAIRTPSWSEQLGPLEGQTRPRTSSSQVLASEVAWPGDECAAQVHRIARDAHRVRDRARRILRALDRAFDAFSRGELNADELRAALDRLEQRAD